jgi:hypothetical protein
MKVSLGKVYGDGSQDVTFDCMSKPMKETLLRLGMIKAMEDAVKANAEWLTTLSDDKEVEPVFTDVLNRPMCKGCRPDTCIGCGEVEDD